MADSKDYPTIQSYFTQYELSIIDSKRELTGETRGDYVRRIMRLFLKGQLINKPIEL